MGIYESLALAIVDMIRPKSSNSLQIGIPIWLLQLWLNAIFESSLKARAPLNSSVGIEGPWLVKLTSDDENVVYLEILEDYLQFFYRCKTFTKSMAPFSKRECGPDWFRKPYPNRSRQEQDEINVV